MGGFESSLGGEVPGFGQLLNEESEGEDGGCGVGKKRLEICSVLDGFKYELPVCEAGTFTWIFTMGQLARLA